MDSDMHRREAKKVSVTGACSLQEIKNTESVWTMRKTGFCEGGHKYKNCLLSKRVHKESVMRTPTLFPLACFTNAILK